MRLRIVWLVARWEFLTTVARPAFLAVLLALPVAHLLLAGLIGVSLATATRPSAQPRELILVDPSGVLPAGARVERSPDNALEKLRDGSIDAVVVLEDDYLASGRVSTFAKSPRGFIDLGNRLDHRERAGAIIQAAMTQDRLTSAEQQRVIRPITSMETFRLSGDTFVTESPFAAVTALTGPFGVCFLLGLSIFIASGSLHYATTVEVSNRMLEMMLCVVRPLELLAGKVLGLGAAGLLQVAVYVVIALLTMQAWPGAIELPLDVAFWSVVFFIAGFAMFAVLMAATGVLTRDPADSMNVISIWMVASALPFFFILQFNGEPASGMVAVLSWMPLTAPSAILIRLGVGGLGMFERIGVLLVILLSAASALVVTARLFSNRVVYGRALVWRRKPPPTERPL